MDIFESKNIKPMLIGESREPFDSGDFIYELKLDGVRGIAYLDSSETYLRNKRNINCNPTYPELTQLHKQTNTRCILDGEFLCVDSEGKPDFFTIQKRALMSDPMKIRLAQSSNPVSFVAYDILYRDNKELTNQPLMERKEILKQTVSEGGFLSLSRYIEEKGTAFYNLTVKQELEGIVAKRKISKYYFDKRTKDWIKIKNLLDDDFVVCGYIEKENSMCSIVLGQYSNGNIIYKGHVTLGVSGRDYQRIINYQSDSCPFKALPPGNESAVWIAPELVCTVKFMQRTESGGIRQPVFKGLRDDKCPKDCIE